MRSIFCRSVGFAGVFLATAIFAQFSIPWHTIDGGGGTSTSSVYSVSGTIGQPHAGRMSGETFTLEGGFWAVPTAVQSPGYPWLMLASTGPGQATVSWSPATPGYILQESLSLSPAVWTNSPSGSTNPIVVPATLPARFYRLFKP
jgi:hypothetical protein